MIDHFPVVDRGVLVLCLIVIGDFVRPTASKSTNCSRVESSIARRFLREKIAPAYDKMSIGLPEGCPLNKDWDIFGRQDLMISKESDERWRCGWCGKEFYSEEFVWRHMDNKHSDGLQSGSRVVCLADLCPILRCEIIGGRYNKQPKTNWAQKLCNREDMSRLKSRCTEIIYQCLGSIASDRRKILKDYLETTICGFLTCENYWQLTIKSTYWALNIYIGIAVFVGGLIMYYVALFVRLNKVESGITEDVREYKEQYAEHRCKYRGADLTYRGNKNSYIY